ncbi:MAG: hypothetical protein AAF242_02505 [Bacteroidota bacterium]
MASVMTQALFVPSVPVRFTVNGSAAPSPAQMVSSVVPSSSTISPPSTPVRFTVIGLERSKQLLRR